MAFLMLRVCWAGLLCCLSTWERHFTNALGSGLSRFLVCSAPKRAPCKEESCYVVCIHVGNPKSFFGVGEEVYEQV